MMNIDYRGQWEARMRMIDKGVTKGKGSEQQGHEPRVGELSHIMHEMGPNNQRCHLGQAISSFLIFSFN
jgi:hypothetical protein